MDEGLPCRTGVQNTVFPEDLADDGEDMVQRPGNDTDLERLYPLVFDQSYNFFCDR